MAFCSLYDIVILSITCVLYLTSASIRVVGDAENPKLYIVYMGAADERQSHLLSGHHSRMLASISNSTVESAKESIVFSYTRAINGFAAKMLPSQASRLERMPGVVSVFEDYPFQLQTSRSMNFLGLEDASGQIPTNSLWKKTNGMGDNLIIGVIDSGIWPESRSFSDAGLPSSIPSKWRGSCPSGFPCNKKIIGARYYGTGFGPSSPRDTTGHGSHVSSIAAGAFVSGVDDKGFARGTVKGVAPRARIAAYKICWIDADCSGARVLKGWDDAIGDGVDVINYSVKGTADAYARDIASIGAFHAIQKGIVVVAAAGNGGPTTYPVANTAPWIMTVAASWTDRRFQSNVVLGNGAVYEGSSTTVFDLKNTFYPLAIGAVIPSSSSDASKSGFCSPKSLDPAKARGKIILCDAGISFDDQANEIKTVGAIGFILANTAVGKERLFSLRFTAPGTEVGNKAANAIRSYIKSTSNPLGTIQKPETLTGQKPSPMMGISSSQGPNTIVPDILKPDVTAPGVDILAAWSLNATQSQDYKLDTGTSMASPHVAGLSTVLKSLHPDWSPAAIKSAIMTTAYTTDNTGKSILDGDLNIAGPFNYGAGHINPNAADNPGLVYDAGENDYVTFLCNIGFSSSQIQAITGKSGVTCSSTKGRASDLNYPSVTVTKLAKSATVTRTFTSVSDSSSTYTIRINPPQGVTVTANPTSLAFSRKGERKTFTLNFVVKTGFLPNKYVFGDYVWDDKIHTVRSPIVVNAVSMVSEAEEQLLSTI